LKLKFAHYPNIKFHQTVALDTKHAKSGNKNSIA